MEEETKDVEKPEEKRSEKRKRKTKKSETEKEKLDKLKKEKAKKEKKEERKKMILKEKRRKVENVTNKICERNLVNEKKEQADGDFMDLVSDEKNVESNKAEVQTNEKKVELNEEVVKPNEKNIELDEEVVKTNETDVKQAKETEKFEDTKNNKEIENSSNGIDHTEVECETKEFKNNLPMDPPDTLYTIKKHHEAQEKEIIASLVLTKPKKRKNPNSGVVHYPSDDEETEEIRFFFTVSHDCMSIYPCGRVAFASGHTKKQAYHALNKCLGKHNMYQYNEKNFKLVEFQRQTTSGIYFFPLSHFSSAMEINPPIFDEKESEKKIYVAKNYDTGMLDVAKSTYFYILADDMDGAKAIMEEFLLENECFLFEQVPYQILCVSDLTKPMGFLMHHEASMSIMR